MAVLRFTSIMKIRGANPYVLVSAARARIIKPDWRKPLPVLVRINGQPKKAWHINMMSVGDGSFYLYLHGIVRKASGTKVGDRVNVELQFDKEYKNGPMHPMPDWFGAPLTKNKKAMQAWEALTGSRQKEILRYLSSLKSREAQARNITRALRVLSGTKGRFMGRSWKSGQ
jgi:hypothetical protein